MVYTWARGYQQNASLVTKERPPQTGEIQRGQKGDLYVHPLSPPTLLSPPKKKKKTNKRNKTKKTPEHNVVKPWMWKTWGFYKNMIFQNNMET